MPVIESSPKTIFGSHAGYPTPVVQRRADADLHDLATLPQLLRHTISQSGDVDRIARSMLALLTKRQNVIGSFLIRRSEGQQLSHSNLQLRDETLDVSNAIETVLGEVDNILHRSTPATVRNKKDGLASLVVPVQLSNACAFVAIVPASLDPAALAIELAIGQLLAAYSEIAIAQNNSRNIGRDLRAAASSLELVMNLQRCESLTSASIQIVADLIKHFQCDEVFIGIARGEKTCKVTASTNVAKLDPNAESTMMLKAVLDECLARDEWGAWPPLPGASPHRLLAHKQLARRDSLVLSVPLRDQAGSLVGALGIRGRREMAAVGTLALEASALGEPLGTTLGAIRSRSRSLAGRILNAFSKSKRRSKLLMAAMALVAGMAILTIPVPYTISCQTTAEPIERRFIVAPHAGLLESSLAQPGDVVAQGQLLAQMDGREILWEVAGVVSEKSRAAKKRDVHLAKQETPESIMADLEMRRLANQEALLNYKKSNLLMYSPIDGVVLSGSLDRRENYPVTKGQILYEVAPIDKLRVEIAVPAESIPHVQVGDAIHLYFEGFEGQVADTIVEKIRPRSEVRASDNVFVAEVIVNNRDGALRPGMAGRGKIRTDHQSIGWIVFHRVIEKANAHLPW